MSVCGGGRGVVRLIVVKMGLYNVHVRIQLIHTYALVHMRKMVVCCLCIAVTYVGF